MANFFDTLVEVLKADERLFSLDGGELLRNKVYELAMAMDAGLLALLIGNEETKKRFFTDVNGTLVFDKMAFGWVVNNRQFLPDSYTRFKNRIGLADSNGNLLSSSKALIAIGISPEKQTDITYKIKDEFKQEDFFLHGLVFSNKRKVKSRKDVRELLPSIRVKEYFESIDAGRTAMDTMMMNAHTNTTVKTFQYRTTIGAIAQENYSLVHAALRRCDALKFNLLKKFFPNLTGIREFITDDAYLGKVSVLIESREEKPAPDIVFTACLRILGKIGSEIASIKETYIGTREFSCSHFHEIFKAKTLHITDPHGEGEGISQNADAIRPEWKINLADQDWFIFNDNFGTTEEKAFVAFFATYVERLKEEYEKVYLVRNERQLVLYSFEGGERFEPDYLLFLRKKNATGFEQYQLFVEPKGNHLLEQDKWKEEFLLQIAKTGKTVKTFVDDGHYHILGLPFFNQQNRMKEIRAAFEEFLSKSEN